MTTKISIREYLRNYKTYNAKVMQGESFVIAKNDQDQVMISPVVTQKKYTMKDLLSIRIKNGGKDLSKNIDKIVYGL